MKIFKNSDIKKVLGLSSLPPVYYVDSNIVVETVIENNMRVKDPSIEAVYTPTMSSKDVVDCRPFDDMVIIAEIPIIPEGSTPEEIRNSPKIHNMLDVTGNAEGEVTIRMFISGNGVDWKYIDPIGGYKNMLDMASGLISEPLDSFMAEDIATRQYIEGTLRVLIMPFAIKNVGLAMVKGVARNMSSKKGKRSPQNYLVVTNNRKEYEKSTKGHRVIEYHHAFKVCGHWRYYKKNPDTLGHDRYRNVVTGKTWVRPYTKGEGLELIEKIRIFVGR